MSIPDTPSIESAFSVGHLLDPSDEKAFWLAKSPIERLEAVEVMRQIIYGYDPTTTRLQREKGHKGS